MIATILLMYGIAPPFSRGQMKLALVKMSRRMSTLDLESTLKTVIKLIIVGENIWDGTINMIKI